jgi:membrane associated rhomboid family serine protease
MIAGRHSEDYYPITWVGRIPIYVTTLLVIVEVLAMIGTSLAMAMAGTHQPIDSPVLAPLMFSNTAILQSFKIWQFVTYPFVNGPSIWFAIEMFLLYSFGGEVEKFLGRRAFLWLYLSLILVAPVVLTALGLAGVPAALAGSGPINFAVFVAFAVLYPNVPLFFCRIEAKWVAAILMGIYTLQYIAYTMWVDLGVIWLESICAVLMLRLSGATNASMESWLPALHDDLQPDRPMRALKPRNEPVEVDLHESIDPLLEKISRHGIGSLTKRERQRLEQARAALLEREKPSR